MRVGSSSSLSGLSTVDFFPVFPWVFSPGVSWLSLTGFDFAGLVGCVILALWSWNLPSRSIPFSRFITFWRLCDASWSPPLFPRSLRCSLASCLAALPLPHYRWSRVHGRSSAGLMMSLSSVSDRLVVVLRQLLGSGVCSPASTICPPSRVLKQRSFGFSASISLRVFAMRSPFRVGFCLSPRSERRLFLHLPGVLVGAFAMRPPLRVEYFSDLDRTVGSSLTFPRV